MTHSTLDLINSVSEDEKDLDNELRDIVKTPLSFLEFSCHTQAVECGIKFVTEAAIFSQERNFPAERASLSFYHPQTLSELDHVLSRSIGFYA